MKKVDLVCPRCHAVMDINEERTEGKCAFCGYRFLIEKEETIEQAAERARMVSFAETEGKKLAEEASHKRRVKRKILTIVFSILIIFAVICALLFAGNMSKEKLDNPFQYVTVSFSGIDGKGEAEITVKGIEDIDFELSKSNYLIEGEKITLYARSSKYRFDESKKEIVVSGLSLYLNDLNTLGDEQREFIHNNAISFQTNEIKRTYASSAEIEDIKPYKLYLSYKSNSNILYDVLVVTIKTRGGKTYDKYVVTSYKDIVLNKSSNEVSFSERKRVGNLIKAGDPNLINSIYDTYAGNLWGYLTIDDFESYLKTTDTTYKTISE